MLELLKIALDIEFPRRCFMFVISPLVSLMEDQISRYRALGLSSIMLGRSLEDQEELLRIKGGEYMLVFMSPEALLN